MPKRVKTKIKKDKEKKKDNGEKRTDNDASGKNLIDSPLTSALLSNGLSNEDYTGLDTNYLYRGYPDIAVILVCTTEISWETTFQPMVRLSLILVLWS